MRCRFLLALVLPLCWLPAVRPADSAAAPEGFMPLFNGKDLSGWKVYKGKMDAWGVDEGLLYVKAGGGGWLMTEKEYGDFDLRLEYRMPKMGNSGVAVRAPLEGDPAYQGMEIQLLDDDNWKGLRPAQFCGSIYDVVPPSKHVTKPAGEWNKMRITARGRKVTVELNGTEIVNADLDDHKDKAKAHPGLLRSKGHLGFQSYNYRVDFRNIYVKPL
jgi:hypothetical protein